MSSEQLYANGRIAVLSNRLFSADKFVRLAECKTQAEALKLLAEYGYSSGADCEQVLRAELDKALAELAELCTNRNARRFLLCRYDYHNAKVLMKGKYMRSDCTQYCFSGATYEPQDMRDAFNSDSYDAFSKNMAEACDAIDASFADGNRQPQTVDRLLDKAYFADLRHFASASMCRLVERLCALQIDCANLTLIRRLHKAQLDEQTFAQWMVKGGSISAKTLASLWNGASVAELPEQWRRLYQSDNPERFQWAMCSELVAQYADPLTLQPVLQYFYSKVEETELVRQILADVKNGVDKDKIKERINAK